MQNGLCQYRTSRSVRTLGRTPGASPLAWEQHTLSQYRTSRSDCAAAYAVSQYRTSCSAFVAAYTESQYRAAHQCVAAYATSVPHTAWRVSQREKDLLPRLPPSW
eukprot:1114002-Rhodomonas_salina.2